LVCVFLKIYLFILERESEHKRGGGAKGEGETILKQTPC